MREDEQLLISLGVLKLVGRDNEFIDQVTVPVPGSI